MYDVINLFRHDSVSAASDIRKILAKKRAYVDKDIPTYADVMVLESRLRRNWERMLIRQLPAVPNLEAYWNSLPEFFSWFDGDAIQRSAPLGTISKSGLAYQPPYGRLGLTTRSGNSLEVVRFAGSSQLCVKLDYTDERGNRSLKTIEPYSFRKTKTGDVLLHAVQADNVQTETYEIDKINDVSMTPIAFTPRYSNELRP